METAREKYLRQKAEIEKQEQEDESGERESTPVADEKPKAPRKPRAKS